MFSQKELQEWLKVECNTLQKGRPCQTLRCLKNAGYKGGPYKPEELQGTCEALQISLLISEHSKIQSSARALITRHDFWNADFEPAGLAIPGEYDDLCDTLAKAEGKTDAI